MSASRDKSQKVAFVYSNLYQIYKDGKTGTTAVIKKTDPNISSPILNGPINHDPKVESKAAAPIETPKESVEAAPKGVNPGLTVNPAALQRSQSGKVLKAKDLKTSLVHRRVDIRKYEPVRLEEAKRQQEYYSAPLEDLKRNIKSLSDIQSRLRFMLKEIDDLVKDDE